MSFWQNSMLEGLYQASRRTARRRRRGDQRPAVVLVVLAKLQIDRGTFTPLAFLDIV
jgi:hypothetical protein